jgi:hypothetical protein
MFQLRKTNRATRRDDRGMAVVAAIGVAFILMMILTIVVAVTVSTTNNSARDRVRTASIHSAEGALDATLAAMEHDIVCVAPSFSPLTVGEGAQQTIVTVAIKYYSDDLYESEVICSGGALAGTATHAIVKATAVPAHAAVGVQPSRTIEARLAVAARGETYTLPGVYAAKGMWLSGTPDFFSPSTSSAPDIWVDTGNLSCTPAINRQTEIEADVVVGQGDALLQEWCWFTRDLFVGDDMTWQPNNVDNNSQLTRRCNDKFICGDLTIRGDLTISSSAERLTTGANVTVGGSISDPGHRLVANGAVTQHVAGIEEKDIRGFPTVEYNPANWLGAYGMNPGLVADFQNELAWKSYQQCTGSGRNRVCVTKYYGATNVADCNFDSQYYDSTIRLNSAHPMVYDMRDCGEDGLNTRSDVDVMKFLSTNTIMLYHDTAFIVSGFYNSGTLNFVSANGNPYRVWIIVADTGVPTYTPPAGGAMPTCSSATLYDLCSTHILTTAAETPIMWYTKHLFYSEGDDATVNDMYGQMFAGAVVFKDYIDLRFETLPIPNEILWDPGDQGFDIQLLSKRELPKG